MSREKYLWKRRKGPKPEKGFWSFQITVPRDLHGKFRSATGKPLSKIVEALHVDSLTEARKLRDQKLAEWQARFDRARQDAPLSLVEIEAEAREAYYRMLEALELSGERKGAKTFIEDIGMTEEESDIFSHQCVIEEALEEDDWQKAERAIKGIERQKGVTLDRESKTYSLLARAVLRAQLDALNGRSNLLKGEPSTVPKTFLGADGIDPSTLQVRAATKPARAVHRIEDGLQFSEAAKRYLAEVQRDPAAKLTEHTRGQNEFVYRLFEAFTDNAPLATIDKRRAADFLDHVAEERGLSNRTLNRYTSALSAVWTWADRRGHYEGRNPFKGQWRDQGKGTGYRQFDVAELNKLFAGSLFRETERIRPTRYTFQTAMA
jgi:hypothetical protein